MFCKIIGLLRIRGCSIFGARAVRRHGIRSCVFVATMVWRRNGARAVLRSKVQMVPGTVQGELVRRVLWSWTSIESASAWRRLATLAVLAAALLLPSLSASAQTCTTCTLYASTELNLRQDPSIGSPVLRFVPAGAPVHRTAGAEVNDYAPVTYDGVPGWVVALGLVASPDEVEPVTEPAPPATDANTRVTLSPLLLRGGPSAEAESILVMPEGATVTLTREGAENGYVTVDYDGQTGWAYADLLAEPGAR
jgi:uncharacterized protein YraI